MWTFTGGSLFGGVLVMGLSFISPWLKPSDPSFDIVPHWDMCPNSSTIFTSSQEERLSLLERRLREMISDQSTTQMAHVSLYIDNHIQEAVSFLNESLNTPAETRFHEVLRKQDEIVNKTEEYKQNITGMIAKEGRRCRTNIRNAHKTVVRILETFANKTENSVRTTSILLFVMMNAIDFSLMKGLFVFAAYMLFLFS